MLTIDTDVSKVDRPRAIEYLKQKYGEEHVCQIITFGQYKLKNTIKAVLSAERGFSSEYQNSITKTIPDMIGEEGASYELIEKIAKDPDKYSEDLTDREMSQVINCYNVLQEVFKENPEVHDAITKLRGAIASTGIHAGGVVISSKSIGKHIPLMKGSETAVLPVCQADMSDVTFFNGLKIDVLGLKTLSQIKLCMELAAISRDWLENEDTDDKDIYEFLRAGNTANVFQMHKFTPTAMIKDFKVSDLEGLTAVNAGNRPGPLAKGDDGKSMVDRYAESVMTGEIPSLDPRIDFIFAPTNGQMWYQEQLQLLGQVMAGYSLGDADLRIRKVIAKKLRDKIPEIRNEFVYGKKSIYDNDGKVIDISEEDSPYCIGAVRNGFDENLALKLFKDMEAFASYCFNKSHSAAYGFVAYRTAWLSYYYPVEWNVACLTLDANDGNAKEKIASTLNSCKKRNIKILPPSINTSSTGFTVDKLDGGEKCIRYGFQAIKGVGSNISDMISRLIDLDGKFTSFQDFLDRTINPKTNDTLRALCLEDPAFHSVKIADDGTESKKINNPFKKTNIVPLILSGAFDCLEPNRHKTFNDYVKFKKDKDELKDEAEYKLKDQLAYELDLLGFYVSQHPLDGDAFPYVDLETVRDNQLVKVAGIFKSYETATTKKGDRYYKLKIELKDGKLVSVNIFKNTYTKYPESIQGLSSKKAKEGKEILIVEGKVSLKFNNINANKVLKVRGKNEQDEQSMPELPDSVPELGLAIKDSPMDEDLMMKVE